MWCGMRRWQVYLLEEVVSAVVTPFVLMFCLSPRALDIVDFLRNHTVDVTGVGDVCAFAQMDVRKHGNPQVNKCFNSLTFWLRLAT